MKKGSGSSTSVWMENPLPSNPPLEKDIKADVCVIGAGIAGLSTAYLLADSDRSVAVLDDGAVGGGETSRTTAHLVTALAILNSKDCTVRWVLALRPRVTRRQSIASKPLSRKKRQNRNRSCGFVACHCVDWNSAEKTWDCPCHGSRFNPMGKVLNGPANTDLGPVK